MDEEAKLRAQIETLDRVIQAVREHRHTSCSSPFEEGQDYAACLILQDLYAQKEDLRRTGQTSKASLPPRENVSPLCLDEVRSLLSPPPSIPHPWPRPAPKLRKKLGGD